MYRLLVLGRLIGSLIMWAFLLSFGWGETVGIVHAFRKHGVGDGFAALFVPPYAWWRGVEFFFHRRQLSSTEFDRIFTSLAVARGVMVELPTGPVLVDMERGQGLLDSLTRVYGRPSQRTSPADPCLRYRLSKSAQRAGESLMVARWGPLDDSGKRSSMSLLSNAERLQELVRGQAAFDSLLQVRCAHLP